MKRQALFLSAAIPILLLLSLSCTRQARSYEITGGEGSVMYSASQSATFLYARCWLLSRNPAHARITGWGITYRSGKKKLLEVNDANHQAYAPYVVHWDIYAYDKGSFTLQCYEPGDPSNTHPYPGKLFPASVPDNMDIRLTLTDADGKTEDVERNIEVIYSSGL